MVLLHLLFNLNIIYDYLIDQIIQPCVALCSFWDLEKPCRGIEIGRNRRPEELLKLGAGQKFIFREGRGACPMRRRSEKFHFKRGGGGVLALWGGGGGGGGNLDFWNRQLLSTRLFYFVAVSMFEDWFCALPSK